MSNSLLSTQASELVLHTDNYTDFLYYQNDKTAPASLSAQSNKLTLDLLTVPIRYEYMPFKRTLKLMSSGAQVCSLDKLVTQERKKTFMFSLAMNLFLSRQLYQQAEITDLNTNAVELVQLFERQQQFKLLLTSQINYGEALEKQIAQIAKSQKIYRNSGEHAQGLVDMFILKRADYALFYPQQVKELNVDLNARTYEIKGIPAYVTGHLMCPKGKLSALLIQEVNEQLKHLYQTGELLTVHLEHIDSQNKKRVTRYFQQLH